MTTTPDTFDQSTFARLSDINRARSAHWHATGEPWTLADWSNALCGEAGELANLIKKVRRIQTGTHGRYQEQDASALATDAMMEIADVFLYLDLLAEQLQALLEDQNQGFDIWQAIAYKFNQTSRQYNFLHRMYMLEPQP